MNAARLLQHYERIADAPDAISRLRRFILDLAARGKLVPQDASDETAKDLLKRIAKEKARLVKEGRIKDKPLLPNVTELEAHFPIPPSWEWVRLANIIDFSAGRTPSRNDPTFWNNGDHAWVSIADIEDGQILTTTKETVSDKARERIFGCEPEAPGTILMSFKLTIGKIARLGVQAFHNEAIISIRPHLPALDGYLFKVLPGFARQGDTKGAIKGATLNRDSISNVLLPLPPLAEQRRIVAKVDELMGLCDQLEAARNTREATRDRLAAASLARLNAPNHETFPADARFALDSLPALTTRPDQIKQLRQTILNLAVRGKLVPQDPNDEPASELLKRFAKAKTDRKKETGDARIKAAPDPTPDELDMPLPSGWAVQSFENLFLFIDYRGNTPPKTDSGIPLITAKNIRMGYLNREPREFISKATFKSWMTRGFPEIDDLFFTTEAPLANICLNDIEEPFALAQRAICFQPYDKIETRFLMFAIMSDVMQSLIDKHATGMTAKGIKAAKLKPLPIPIPPLAEQRRIVARVDELLALCDRLEASLTAGADTRRRLLDALLADALAPSAAIRLEAAE
jgi:type I restriction enzyme, S subunit